VKNLTYVSQNVSVGESKGTLATIAISLQKQNSPSSNVKQLPAFMKADNQE